MGQTLSEPITEKQTSSGSNRNYIYAVSAMQGWRVSMEDAHTTILNLVPELPNDYAFFAVFDGHGGPNVAKLAGNELYKSISNHGYFRARAFKDALEEGYFELDAALRVHPELENDTSGCTAVSALFTPATLYVANAGDSRAVLATKSQVIPMSFDHKPVNPTEAERIYAAGGFLEYGRVNGNLALSRALGDFEFKQNYSLPPKSQIVTAHPDITEHAWSEEDEFLILACDGIWDCFNNHQCVHYIRYQLASGLKLPQACEALIDYCLAPTASEWGALGCDNMTVIIVGMLNGKSEETWYDWMQYNYSYLLNEPLPLPLRRLVNPASSDEDDMEESSNNQDSSNEPYVGVQS